MPSFDRVQTVDDENTSSIKAIYMGDDMTASASD